MEKDPHDSHLQWSSCSSSPSWWTALIMSTLQMKWASLSSSSLISRGSWDRRSLPSLLLLSLWSASPRSEGESVDFFFFFPPTLGGCRIGFSLSLKCHTRTMMLSTGLAPYLNCSTNIYQKQLMQSLLLINDLSWRFKKNSKTHHFWSLF